MISGGLKPNIDIRESIEEKEFLFLHNKASFSRSSKGRLYLEEKSPFRTDFMRDRDRIIHSKAFRRLLNKTQVFIAPNNDHFRTRLTHSLEVMQISTDIARAVNLNRDLTEAIALGHDLGHPPFGHIGERELDKCYKSVIKSGRFKHAEFSLRIVDELETRNYNCQGLNLTWEVRDGILNHSKGLSSLILDVEDDNNLPQTLEGMLVRIVDRIAYISHDFDDALRSGYIKICDLNSSLKPFLSKGTSYIINYFASDLILNFSNYKEIRLSKEKEELLNEIKNCLNEKLYSCPETLKERHKASLLINELFYYFLDSNDKFKNYDPLPVKVRKIVDYIAGMTDRFAITTYEEKVAHYH